MKGLVNLTLMLSKLLIWLIRSLDWLFVGFGPLVRFVLKPFGWLLNPILIRFQDPAVRQSMAQICAIQVAPVWVTAIASGSSSVSPLSRYEPMIPHT